MYPKLISELIESLQIFPGVGRKTAERLAFSVLEMDSSNVETLAKSLIEARNNIKKCKYCNSYSDQEVCYICADKDRNNDLLCVVDDPKALFLFEKLGSFKGKYFVLNSLISPLDGIGSDDIGIDNLIRLIKENDAKEVILAFKQSVEGEATALYLKTLLSNMPVKITRIASGVPLGADIEYIDVLTLERAIEDRREL